MFAGFLRRVDDFTVEMRADEADFVTVVACGPAHGGAHDAAPTIVIIDIQKSPFSTDL